MACSRSPALFFFLIHYLSFRRITRHLATTYRQPSHVFSHLTLYSPTASNTITMASRRATRRKKKTEYVKTSSSTFPCTCLFNQ